MAGNGDEKQPSYCDRIIQYIVDEHNARMNYEELSVQAPDPMARDKLLEIAGEEGVHLLELFDLYATKCSMTGSRGGG